MFSSLWWDILITQVQCSTHTFNHYFRYVLAWTSSIHIKHKYPISLNKHLGAHLKFCLKEGCLFEGGCLNEGGAYQVSAVIGKISSLTSKISSAIQLLWYLFGEIGNYWINL